MQADREKVSALNNWQVVGQFKFKLTYRPSSWNVKPDALSWLFPDSGGDLVSETILPSFLCAGRRLLGDRGGDPSGAPHRS